MNRTSVYPEDDWYDAALLPLFAVMLVIAAFFFVGYQFVWPAFISARLHFAYLLVCAIFFMPFVCLGRFRIPKTILYALFLIFVARLWFFPVSSRQSFLHDLDRVQIGMTRPKVEAIMAKYSPHYTLSITTKHGIFYRRLAQTDSKNKMERADAISYGHSTEAEYNADVSVVSFRNGRVSEIEFRPD